VIPVRRPLLALIGPSGAGKSTVARTLADRWVIRLHPTWTTRERRADELDGSPEHRFVSDEEFLRRRHEGFFLHTVQMFGLPAWYGLPSIEWADHGPVDCVMLRAGLVPQMKQFHPNVLVYQIDAPSHLLTQRLCQRSYEPAELHARLRDNDDEKVSGRRIADRRFNLAFGPTACADAIERWLRHDTATVGTNLGPTRRGPWDRIDRTSGRRPVGGKDRT